MIKALIPTRADTLIPRDRVDLDGYIATVAAIEYIDVDAPGRSDRVLVTWTGTAICNVSEVRAGHMYGVLPK